MPLSLPLSMLPNFEPAWIPGTIPVYHGCLTLPGNAGPQPALSATPVPYLGRVGGSGAWRRSATSQSCWQRLVSPLVALLAHCPQVLDSSANLAAPPLLWLLTPRLCGVGVAGRAFPSQSQVLCEGVQGSLICRQLPPHDPFYCQAHCWKIKLFIHPLLQDSSSHLTPRRLVRWVPRPAEG